MRRTLRIGLFAICALIAIPVVLTPLYAIAPPVSTPMLWRKMTGQPVEREWRNLDQLSDRLKAAVIMSEDGQFCRHQGIDLGALRAEIEALQAGDTPRGASTITMQVARNLFLWTDRSYIRKVLEIPLAVYIDLVLSKRRILEIYLNIAEWGPNGEFGAEAGAEAAFGTSAEALSWQKAALLTAALPNPHLRLPGSPSRGMDRVAAIVERRAEKAGKTYLGCIMDLKTTTIP